MFRNNLIGEFRYGLGLRDTNVNIAAGNDTPIVRFVGRPTGLGTIIGNAGTFPILRDQLDNQFVYNLSWLFGRNHVLKAGTDIRRQQLDDFADSNSRGFWNFDRVCGGVTYATSYDAFLDGCITTFTKAWGPFFLENRINESNFYAEDNWRIHPDLTLNLGFRYEYVSAPREKEGRIDYGFGDDTDNYEPRLGAAWTLPPSDGWFADADGKRVRRLLAARRVRPLSRASLPVRLLTVGRDAAVQSAQCAHADHHHAQRGHPERRRSDARVRLRAGAADRAPQRSRRSLRICRCRTRTSGA